ncbi:hypothetical protein HUG17_6823 [Dermatophagoides farinae]|uniref:Uncharacterized protein n=1 Tax=Dermatophagoides farinae TaxID=6954 RepID=A0A9D4P564_DERFA|nr:hypothetical protein HUG17_6823 [Dermatophagoides farinae]
MNNQRQSRSQLDTTIIAQLNCNKSPSALNQFLSFCDKNKVDIAMITEPPIRKGIPNIKRKYNPLYATNSYVNHHLNNYQPNHHLNVSNLQPSSSSSQSSQQMPPSQQTNSAGLGPSDNSNSSNQPMTNNQQASINNANISNQQIPILQQPPSNQQSINSAS